MTALGCLVLLLVVFAVLMADVAAEARRVGETRKPEQSEVTEVW